MKRTFLMKMRLFIREWQDFLRFSAPANAALRTLVFYAERDIYYQYYEGYVNYILEYSDLSICYLTSDPDDPVFQMNSPRIRPFYLDAFLPRALSQLDAKVLVLTMSDLNLYHIKRSRHGVNHVYVFHGVGSTHLHYHKRAFEGYDTILCIGPHEVQELRKAEEFYGFTPKTLVPCGYYRIEKLYQTYQEQLRLHSELPSAPPTILIAPSWHPGNILESCITELITVLKDSEYRVIIRPHPEFIKRYWETIARLQQDIAGIENITLELNMVMETSILNADVLVTDWSAISFEYAFGTERPVLFINTPCRINNPDYTELGLEPIEFTLRNRLGQAINIEDIPRIPRVLQDFLELKASFREQIVQCRTQYLYHWLHSAEIGGEFLINACKCEGGGT